MKSRKPLVAGNWKMNGDIVTNEHLFTALRSALERSSISQAEVVICPPFPYLGQAGAWLGDTDIAWGAQNVAAAPNGALTGEVSVSMLLDLGCKWTIVGHSERRVLLGESDETVGRKAGLCVAGGLGVIACVGETLAQREAGETDTVLARQVDALVPALQKAEPARVVVAYEPVWAIGTGRTAAPETAQAAHAFIRSRLADAGVAGAGSIRIVYGGSVKPANAMSLFGMPDIDGGLIGGASLVAEEFFNICRAAAVA